MSHLKNVKPSGFNRIAWATGALCIACCAAPFSGIAIGSATLAAFSLYSEVTAIVIVVLLVTLLANKYISRKKISSCDLDCSYRPTPNKEDAPKIN